MLTLQWLLYLLVTIGSYYKWWVESNQGPGVYSFSSTPAEDLEGPMHQLQQECTWLDQKMDVSHSSPPAPSAPSSPPLYGESASGERGPLFVEGEASNILDGAALVRHVGCSPPHPMGPKAPNPQHQPAPAGTSTSTSTGSPAYTEPPRMPIIPRMPRFLTTEHHVEHHVEHHMEHHMEHHV